MFDSISRLANTVVSRRRYIVFLVRNQLKSLYRNSFLGPAWVFLPALAKVAVYGVVFGTLFSSRLPGSEGTHAFTVYLVTGLMLWESFNLALMQGVRSYSGSRALILAGTVPKGLLPVIFQFESLVNAFINLVILIGLALVLDGFYPAPWASAIPLILLQQIFATCLGVTLGLLRVFFVDIEHLTGILVQVWFWATPVVYPVTILPEVARAWFSTLNPMYYFMEKYHAAFIAHDVLTVTDIIPGVLIGVAALATSCAVYFLLRMDLESAL